MKTQFTSESVTCGHPGKVCGQIAGVIPERNPKSHGGTHKSGTAINQKEIPD